MEDTSGGTNGATQLPAGKRRSLLLQAFEDVLDKSGSGSLPSMRWLRNRLEI